MIPGNVDLHLEEGLVLLYSPVLVSLRAFLGFVWVFWVDEVVMASSGRG